MNFIFLHDFLTEFLFLNKVIKAKYLANMASLIVPSRFACLKIEDDDEDIQTRRLNKKPAATANSKTEQYNKKSSNNNKNDQYKKNNNKHNVSIFNIFLFGKYNNTFFSEQ